MDFRVFEPRPGEWPQSPDTVLLRLLDWNDWFKWRTLYQAWYVDVAGQRHELGTVKIGKLDHVYQNDRAYATPLREEFKRLGHEYVSVGQDETYYLNVRKLLGKRKAVQTLRALGDLAVDSGRFDAVRSDDMVAQSLLREVAAATVKNKFARIIETGDDSNAAYDFVYERPAQSKAPLPPTRLTFEVHPGSKPPTNVHVLIGRNGSGKTTLLRSMARAMLGQKIAGKKDGYFRTETGGGLDVANLVYVSFSAFEEAQLPVLDKRAQWAVPYSYVGLQYIPDLEEDPPGPELPERMDAVKTTRRPADLGREFADSAYRLVKSGLRKDWRAALETLESDPNFNEAEVATLADQELDERAVHEEALDLWETLSTGHKIVLLTVTRLVETVTERTLVLIDEPEGHLHPPLLSAFIRALSDLLQDQNGVAVVATHSPVILQEVPAKCAHKVRRVGLSQIADRPRIETFGESIGLLTSEVFSLEVTDSGYHRMLTDAAMEAGSYERVVAEFSDELGFEARAILQAWFASQNA